MMLPKTNLSLHSSTNPTSNRTYIQDPALKKGDNVVGSLYHSSEFFCLTLCKRSDQKWNIIFNMKPLNPHFSVLRDFKSVYTDLSKINYFQSYKCFLVNARIPQLYLHLFKPVPSFTAMTHYPTNTGLTYR